jgi:predicted Zn-ribbon and HTH transcriptional regulator
MTKGVIIMEATEKVLEVMRETGEPLNAGKIADISGLERKAVDKAMAQLKKEEKIISPKRCYWAPAE